ncbi:helix-turn-helix domain-containing protein [Enterococcus rotai]|uniref:helix-turn-helix domain-containing protein n=1 Tax=Enterococcus rotai TaxID=118060 RepID=UPI0032B3F375
MESMGDRIKRLRIANNMTQEELGDKVGLKRAAINKYEKGNVENMKRSVIEKMSAVFDVTPSFLMALDNESEISSSKKGSLESVYKITDIRKEALSIVDSLSSEGVEKWFEVGYDLQTQYLKNTSNVNEKTTIQLIETLINAEDVAVRGLAESSKWRYEQVNKLNSRFKGLLEDASLLIDSNRQDTTEFINLKRKIFEAVFPLSFVILGYEKGVNTVTGLSDRYHLSQEFVLEAIAYYVISEGVVTEYDDYLIDFSDIPLNDLKESSDAEFVVTDTNERRIELREKKNKKKFFGK